MSLWQFQLFRVHQIETISLHTPWVCWSLIILDKNHDATTFFLLNFISIFYFSTSIFSLTNIDSPKHTKKIIIKKSCTCIDRTNKTYLNKMLCTNGVDTWRQPEKKLNKTKTFLPSTTTTTTGHDNKEYTTAKQKLYGHRSLDKRALKS